MDINTKKGGDSLWLVFMPVMCYGSLCRLIWCSLSREGCFAVSCLIVSGSAFLHGDVVKDVESLVDDASPDVIAIVGNFVYPESLPFVAQVVARGVNCVVAGVHCDRAAATSVGALSVLSPKCSLEEFVDGVLHINGDVNIDVVQGADGVYVECEDGDILVPRNGAVLVSNEGVDTVFFGTGNSSLVFSPDIPSGAGDFVWVVNPADMTLEDAQVVISRLDDKVTSVKLVYEGLEGGEAERPGSPAEELRCYLESIGVADVDKVMELYSEVVDGARSV